MKRILCATTISLVALSAICGQTASRKMPGANALRDYWPVEKSQAIIEKTQTVRLAPDLSHLTSGERAAVNKLLQVGQIFQELYEEQLHAQALSSHRELRSLDKRLNSPAATQNLLTLYRINQGPVATTLENKRETFLPVGARQVGSNMYPSGVTKEAVSYTHLTLPTKRIV